MNRKIILSFLTISLLNSNLYGWGRKLYNDIEPEKKEVTPVVENEELEELDSEEENSDKTEEPIIKKLNIFSKEKKKKPAMSRKEYQELIVSQLKKSSNTPLNITMTGEPLNLNIPLSNLVLISLPEVIQDLVVPQGNTGLSVLNEKEIKKSPVKMLKIRNINPLLRDEEILVKLINGEWLRLNFSTILNKMKYNEINILEDLDVLKKKKIEKIKAKYFNKNLNVIEISKNEVIKAVNMIIDKLETDTHAHDELVALEEKVNALIFNNNKLGISLILETVVAEPFNIVGGVYKEKKDQKKEKEIVLLNIVIENYGKKNFELTPKFVKHSFNNYIAFYYDINNNIIAPGSFLKLLVVVEDNRLDN